MKYRQYKDHRNRVVRRLIVSYKKGINTLKIKIECYHIRKGRVIYNI